jgi:hypothetical protein
MWFVKEESPNSPFNIYLEVRCHGPMWPREQLGTLDCVGEYRYVLLSKSLRGV